MGRVPKPDAGRQPFARRPEVLPWWAALTNEVRIATTMGLQLGQDDVYQYLVRLGVDLFPPFEPARESLHAQRLHDTLAQLRPELFERLILGPSEFVISRKFAVGPSQANVDVATFVYTPRGPVVTVPIRLGGEVALEWSDKQVIECFREILTAIDNHLPERQKLKLGVVRDVVLACGQRPATAIVAPLSDSCAGAKLTGGQVHLLFEDGCCNLALSLAPIGIARQAMIPVTGQLVQEHEQFGLSVQVDVNTIEVRPLGADDIERVFRRALEVWPQPVLDYLNKRLRAHEGASS